MAPDKVTHEDLRKIEDRQADLRHEQASTFQKMIMNLDEKFDKLNDGFAEIQKDNAVSKKSLEIIVHELEYLKGVFVSHMEREEVLIGNLGKTADEKYAAKWTQSVVSFILVSVGGAVMVALMALIIQK